MSDAFWMLYSRYVAVLRDGHWVVVSSTYGGEPEGTYGPDEYSAALILADELNHMEQELAIEKNR